MSREGVISPAHLNTRINRSTETERVGRPFSMRRPTAVWKPEGRESRLCIGGRREASGAREPFFNLTDASLTA